MTEPNNNSGRADAISIKIGNSDTLEYEITDTNAPADYDGFGTFTVGDFALGLHEDGRPYRVVLIAADHYVWQTARYSSGNHWSRVSVFDADAIRDILWKRITAKETPKPAGYVKAQQFDLIEEEFRLV